MFYTFNLLYCKYLCTGNIPSIEIKMNFVLELILQVQTLEEIIITIMEILFINSQLKVNTDLCLYISIVQGSRNYSLSKITQFMKN